MGKGNEKIVVAKVASPRNMHDVDEDAQASTLTEKKNVESRDQKARIKNDQRRGGALEKPGKRREA